MIANKPPELSILAIDPGPEYSAWVFLIDGKLHEFGYVENLELLDVLESTVTNYPHAMLVIEQIKAMGMAVGAEVFETVFWSGRFAQAWPHHWDRIGRMDVKMHLCGSARAKDKNVRQALVDRFSNGRGEKAAKGTKAKPGPLYGVSGDVWSALAVGVTYWDTKVKASAGVDQVMTTMTRGS